MPQPINTGSNRARRPSASKDLVRLVVDGSTNGTALAAQAATATKPSSGVIETRDFGVARIFFGGTDADLEAFNYDVTLWYPVYSDGVTYWHPTVIAAGLATLSATALPTTIVAANGFYADTLTETVGQPGTLLRSPGSEYIASLDIELRNAYLLQVRTDLTTAAAAYAFVQLGDSASSFADIQITGSGLATSALQTTLNTLLAVGRRHGLCPSGNASDRRHSTWRRRCGCGPRRQHSRSASFDSRGGRYA